jgi:PAS domain S-box-containing protein
VSELLARLTRLGLTSASALVDFVDAAPDGIVIVDDQSEQVALANRCAAQMFGCSREELLGKPMSELLLGQPRERASEAPGGGQAWREFGAPMAGHALLGLRRDGTEFPVELSLSPLRTGAGAATIAFIRDRTGRAQLEAKFRGLLESAPDGIVVVDRSGRIVIVNGQTERIFGYPRNELLGQPIEVLVPARYKTVHEAHRQGYFAHPKTRPMGGAAASLTGRKRDGTEFPLEISLSPMHTEHGLLVTAAIRDITERKQVENQLRRSLQEKEVLLKEIHHRVKNNLQVVSSLLNLQLPLISDPRAHELFKESQDRVRSIALFHEKLYQSKDLARVDLAEYVKGLCGSLFAAYGVDTQRIGLRLEVEDVPLAVDAASSCGLIVNELVSNALKHAFPGGRSGEVRVRLGGTPQALTLEVSDDGVGIPPKVDPLAPSTLGLRLVSILTEQLNGALSLHRGQGTRFVIQFDPSGGRQ